MTFTTRNAAQSDHKLNTRTFAPASLSSLAALIAAALTTACGGGGGGGAAALPNVSSANVAVTNYTQTVTVTLNGSDLDQGVSVTSPACGTLVRSSAAPLVSSATTAYYQCTGAAVGTSQVSVQRDSDGTNLGIGNFSVALPPQVTFTVTDGAGLNGTFVVTLAADPTLTPQTVNNFLSYVGGSFYNGTVFHRVLPGFVVQGGGYLPYTTGMVPSLKINTRPPIALEVNKGLSNKKWTIAMARTSALDSATTQFFINMVDNPGLDPSASSAGYAVFGHVSEGIDVVTAIANSTCTSGLISECEPKPNVVITSAIRTR
ncbi:MAG: peptidylprolyl isomerase [Burkholderiaceae bacterium]